MDAAKATILALSFPVIGCILLRLFGLLTVH